MIKSGSRPLRFLFVHQANDLYGSSKVYLRSVVAVRERWPDCYITCRLPKDGPLHSLLESYVDRFEFEAPIVIRRSVMKIGVLKLLPKFIANVLLTIKEARQYDLVYVNTIVLPSYLLASRFSRSRFLVHCHEIPGKFEGLIFSAILNFSRSSFVFVSSACRRAFFLFPGKVARVIWNGSETPPQEAVACQHAAALPLKLLLIGRFNAWKGQDLFLRALGGMALSDRCRLQVRLVGDVYGDQIEYYDTANSLIAEYCLDSIVSCHPFTDDPSEHYSWSDVVVVPSLRPDPLPLVTIESMSWGRPTIVAAHGGLIEMCIDEKTGYWFAPGDSNSLILAIKKYLDNPSLVRLHGEMAKERFKKEFSAGAYKNNITEFMSVFLDERL